MSHVITVLVHHEVYNHEKHWPIYDRCYNCVSSSCHPHTLSLHDDQQINNYSSMTQGPLVVDWSRMITSRWRVMTAPEWSSWLTPSTCPNMCTSPNAACHKSLTLSTYTQCHQTTTNHQHTATMAAPCTTTIRETSFRGKTIQETTVYHINSFHLSFKKITDKMLLHSKEWSRTYW